MTDHHSYAHNLSSCEIKAWKKIQAWTGFEPVTDTGAVPYQLSYQANREPAMAMLWICNIPVEGEEYKWMYESSYIELQRMIWRCNWSSQLWKKNHAVFLLTKL